jgi:hypothetical protein
MPPTDSTNATEVAAAHGQLVQTIRVLYHITHTLSLPGFQVRRFLLLFLLVLDIYDIVRTV